ncbi:MAG TPA: phosphoglycerate dehydrogenase [bacterium]|uniref:D-3-phosphoglycerate dehydrogenase n=1 Tax=candidate division TA06 bacterium ADurb.Bin417 TaxID=1852828 RepID=A0A1V5MI49_UNCT6|nr:MAG: D-3-phosphoglycerate dehydrogenase [candidate division TA06 bacterium ADurb.Bin417]HNQ34438.1 phosphoglycerate dehydrogenase [bacterium]HNS48152.1 phosphoglycerate dehydrogenase [bacterium]
MEAKQIRVLVTDPLSKEGVAILKNEGFEVEETGKLTPAELAGKVKGFDALVVRSGTRVNREAIAAADNLKVIGRAGVGLDNVDLESATAKGIIVMNSPEGNTISTAEHAFALILSMMRNIPEAHHSVREGRWEKKGFTGTELYRKVLGIIGFGRIGQRVAQYGRVFGMEVLIYDPFVSEEKALQAGVNLVDQEHLLKNADVITLHLPLSEETRDLIGARELALMKKGAFLVNCARGGLVNEPALIEALKSGHLKAAALDVFSEEPPADPAFRETPRLVLTPHLGASTEEAQVNVARDICRQIVDYFRKGIISNAANLPTISEKVLEYLRPYLNLCEKLGLFLAQTAPGRINEVKLEYYGDMASFDLSPLHHSFLKGLLSQMGAGVNYINAPVMAQERGIQFAEQKSTISQEFANLITATVSDSGSSISVSGTLFGKTEPRLVKIDGYRCEAVPEGYLLFCRNEDKPGIVGQIGTLLASRQINIAGMTLGRKERGGLAITILNVDEMVDEPLRERIRQIKEIKSVSLIKL